MSYTPNTQTGPLTGDVTTSGAAATLVGTANVESIIQLNRLDQFAQPGASVPWNNQQLTGIGNAKLATSATSVGALAGLQYPFVISGCVWTADSSGSTLNGSMSAGTVMVKGILLTVAAVVAHAFTASQDTYVDLADNGDGTANITYTAVGNNAASPALANSGTVLNTIRVAIIVSTASALTTGVNTINQGAAPAIATAAQTSTVAAGSNGQAVGTLTGNQLSVAANSLPAAGQIVVATNHDPALLAYTGGGGTTTLTGVSLIAGLGTSTVATGGAVTSYALNEFTDSLGNIIYPTRANPGLVGFRNMGGTFTSTLTGAAVTPILTGTALVAPFIVPPGPARSVRLRGTFSTFLSSGAAGTAYQATLYIGNGTTLVFTLQAKVAVASDGQGGSVSYVTAGVAPGSYTAQIICQNASGTLTVGSTYTGTAISAELA